jgi:SAM-dependent methyltransferase
MNCRFCNENLKNVFVDLGDSPPSNSFVTRSELSKPEAKYPLKVFVCDSCYLVQLAEYKKATEIFSDEYVYFSSYSKSWLAHAKNYTDRMIRRFGFDKNSRVIEIASNDGYLLQYFNEQNIPVLGIEPTANTAKAAEEKGVKSIVDFFGIRLAKDLSSKNMKADLLLGNNVLAHVPDINDFVGGMKIILKNDGVITMEFPHLLQLVENNQFDTIYHEHFSYLSFYSVNKIFNRHGLELFDVDEIPTHGGSLRIYAKHAGNSQHLISENVAKLLNKEIKAGITSDEFYKGFQKKTDIVKTEFLNFLRNVETSGKKVCAYGAAAKGNTLLNYCGVSSAQIPFVVDASPHKQGKFLPGSRIPVVAEDEIKKSRPDYVIIFPWNIKEEITSQLSYIKDWGGRFVVAIPKFQIS